MTPLLSRHGQAFLLAATLLTVLPLGRRLTSEDGTHVQGLAVLYYPLVGMLLGAALWLLALLMASAPAAVAAVVLLMIWVLLTGALHLDGWADCLDALYAGHAYGNGVERRARVLTVMKDPASGAMAVVGLILMLLAKWVCLSQLMSSPHFNGPAWLVLLAWPRAALLPWLLSSHYVRAQGIASALTRQLHTPSALAVTALSALGGLLLLPLPLALGLLVGLVLLTLVWRALWQRIIGGFTGDCLGALVELAELLLLLGLVWWWL